MNRRLLVSLSVSISGFLLVPFLQAFIVNLNGSYARTCTGPFGVIFYDQCRDLAASIGWVESTAIVAMSMIAAGMFVTITTLLNKVPE